MNSSTSNSKDSQIILASAIAVERPAALALRSGVGISAATLSVVRDSLRVLGAFAWGKESRLSKKKSAQLCDLMNAWN